MAGAAAWLELPVDRTREHEVNGKRAGTSLAPAPLGGRGRGLTIKGVRVMSCTDQLGRLLQWHQRLNPTQPEDTQCAQIMAFVTGDCTSFTEGGT